MLIFLLQVLVLLALAYCLGSAADRLRDAADRRRADGRSDPRPILLGYFAPGFSGWLLPADQIQLLDSVAQLGVLLLVGVTGTYLDLGMLRRRRATAIRISLAGLLVPLALGIGLGCLLPAALMGDPSRRDVFALFVGVAMCVTAIPVIAKTLSDLACCTATSAS